MRAETKHLLLIPNARLVPPELQVEFGPVPSGMLPLDGRPALSHIIERYAPFAFDTLIASHEGIDAVYAYARGMDGTEGRICDVGTTESLGETILLALQDIGESVETLAVNFADTLLADDFGTLAAGGDVVWYGEEADSERWTTFTIGPEDNIEQIIDRRSEKPTDVAQVFVGVFWIASAGAFKKELQREVGIKDQSVDPFYRALRAYFNGRSRESRQLLKAEGWHDLGHLDTYYETRRNYFIASRFFNQVSVDPHRGILRKTSSDRETLAAEVSWYRNLPADLRYLGPRVFGASSTGPEPYLEIEYYGYPVLNDAYLFGAWELGTWARVLRVLDLLLTDMAAHSAPVSTTATELAMREMYLEKTLRRAVPLLSDSTFMDLTGRRVNLNGHQISGLATVLDLLPGVLERHEIVQPRPFSVIHGDLTLNNILFDRRSNVIRLVDPRGDFGGFTTFGDPDYDLAKLAHSLHGDYDPILAGAAALKTDAGNITLAIELSPRQRAVKRLFAAWLAARTETGLARIRLLESLLFISMVPLHADRVAVQRVFLARGIQLFDQALALLEGREAPGTNI